jgi:FK506-binding protein 4/5
VKYEARIETGMLVSKSEEGVEFHVGDGKCIVLITFFRC